MHVDKAGVKVAGDGEKIDAVDEQTNVPHIYAVGDVLYVSIDLNFSAKTFLAKISDLILLLKLTVFSGKL